MHGLTVTDRMAASSRIAGRPSSPSASTQAMLARPSVVLVTVKSGATREIAPHPVASRQPEAVVVSLQNGVDNAGVLEAALPGRRVVAGMVPFNVAALGEGRFHRGTDGVLVIDARAAALAAALATPRLPIATHRDMRARRLGQAAAQPQQRAQRAGRRAAARGDREPRLAPPARRVHRGGAGGACAPRASGRPRSAAVPPALIPKVLRLPDPLFRIVAAAQLRIDPNARSSMFDDLTERRITEVDALQGRVVALAAERGTPAPVNRAVLALVKAAEAKGAGSPRLRPEDVRAG